MPQGKLDLEVYPAGADATGALDFENVDYLCIMNADTFGAPILAERERPSDWTGRVLYVPSNAVILAHRYLP